MNTAAIPLIFADGLPENRREAWRGHCRACGVKLADSPTADTFRQPENTLCLFADDDMLSLARAGSKARVAVNFAAGAAQYRRTSGGGELISRAVQPNKSRVVWDATAGLGRDAFVLASLGLDVYAFERHPAVYALLSDGLRRAAAHGDTADTARRICLISGSIEHADAALPAPDVVYLDPMYPPKQKSAAVKKEMAYFHDLVGLPAPKEDAALLQAARRLARRRVVVKRPIHGVSLAGEAAAFQYRGKAVRFDVYLPDSGTADAV